MNSRRCILLLVIGLLLLAGGTSFAAPIKIQAWYSVSGSNGEAFSALVDRFNAEQNEVYVETQFSGGYPQTLNQLRLAVQSKSTPHVVMSYDIGTQTILDSGALVPIQELHERFAPLDIEDFLAPVLQYYTVNDILWGLPFATSNPLLYYNKDLFREAGLDPENPPKSYDEFLETARLLTKKGAQPQYGASWAIRAWLVETQVALHNELYANNSNGRAGRPDRLYINQGAALDFVTLWAEMHKEGVYLNPGRGWDEARNNFASGISAMMLQSTAGLERTLAQVGGAFEVGLAFLPSLTGDPKGGVPVSGNALWALRHSDEEMEATWKFLRWISEPQQVEEWHKATGYFPTRQSVIDKLYETGYYDENPLSRVAIEQLLNSADSVEAVGAVIGPFPEVREFIEQAIERILAGEEGVQEALEKALKESERVLQRYNLLAP